MKSDPRVMLQNLFKTHGVDYTTKLMLGEFYEAAKALEKDGYFLPADLDTQRIEDLISKTDNPEDTSK